jgi:ribosomal protein L19E
MRLSKKTVFDVSDVGVSDFAINIMKKRELGKLNLSRAEINQLIVANAIKQQKTKLH